MPANTVPFPLSSALSRKAGRFSFSRADDSRANTSRSDEWNRGAYLAEALADCSGCHTPRNPLGGEEATPLRRRGGRWLDRARADRGQPLAGSVDARRLVHYPAHRHQPAARCDRRHDDSGHSRCSGACGRAGLRRSRHRRLLQRYGSRRRPCARRRGDYAQGARDFRSRRAAKSTTPTPTSMPRLHGLPLQCGPVPLSARPELALNSALTLSEPTNFIQVVLNGVGDTEGAPGLVMPAYARRSPTAKSPGSRPICVAPARNVRPGPIWKKGRSHPPGVGGIALKEAEQERCDHDHFQSQWPYCFRPQSG